MKNNLRVIDPNNAQPSQKLASPARQKLRDLLDQIAAGERRIREHQVATGRLDAIIAAAVPARVALDEFDRQSAAATAEWARQSLKPPGTAPAVDGKRRLELLADLATAQENAGAAVNARRQFADQIQAEARAIQTLEAGVSLAVAEIIAEVASGSLLADLHEAQRAAAMKRSRLEQALQTVVGIAHGASQAEMQQQIFRLMEGLAETFRTAAPPAVDNAAADRASWEAFAVRLRADAGAELEG